MLRWVNRRVGSDVEPASLRASGLRRNRKNTARCVDSTAGNTAERVDPTAGYAAGIALGGLGGRATPSRDARDVYTMFQGQERETNKDGEPLRTS
eukprot:1178370-Prorocentrum_minimum.AAC.8